VVTYTKVADDPRVHTRSLSTAEPFAIWVKAALLVGAVVASPWIFYQIWMFVAAGLYPHEKKYIHIYLPFSVGLFIAGVCLAFFFAMTPVLDFLLSFNRWMGISPDLRITEWLSFVLLLPLGFGISFQLPLVMLFLERIGLFTAESYTARWKVSVLVIFVISMVCTPGDPTSMLLMAVALTLLYFGGIMLCRFMPRPKKEFTALEP
jgi:sec-independent protein translocase protein TatC